MRQTAECYWRWDGYGTTSPTILLPKQQRLGMRRLRRAAAAAVPTRMIPRRREARQCGHAGCCGSGVPSCRCTWCGGEHTAGLSRHGSASRVTRRRWPRCIVTLIAARTPSCHHRHLSLGPLHSRYKDSYCSGPNRFEVMTALARERELNITGLGIAGKPGGLVVEGQEHDVVRFMELMRTEFFETLNPRGRKLTTRLQVCQWLGGERNSRATALTSHAARIPARSAGLWTRRTTATRPRSHTGG